jgi:hypothetical protein
VEDQDQGKILDPGELLGLSGAYWKSLTLQAGVKLDLFSAVGDKRLTGAEIAGKLGGDDRGVTTLLNALTALGLLSKEDGFFTNTPTGKAFLVKSSPRYIGFIVRHHAHLINSWSRLDEAARAGRPVRDRAREGEDELGDFIMGMHNIASVIAPLVAREVDLRGRRRLLDLGGGPGTWAVYFTLANPGLSSTVFDLSSTRPYAEQTIARFKVSDRVSFHGGDFITDELPCCYDVAWLSHLLHGEGPDSCRNLLKKTVASLEPGGLILIHDFILDDGKTAPLFPALFSLNMLCGTTEGRSYSRPELEEMLAGAGVRDLQLLPFKGPTESRIIAGIV